MEENILADIDKEGQESDDIMSLLGNTDEQESTPAESPTENVQEESDPSVEGEGAKADEAKAPNTLVEDNIPFNKHPRWKQMQDEKAALEEKLSGFDELQQTVQQLQESQKKVDLSNPTLPPEWVALYGEDDASKRAYAIQQQQFSDMENRIRDNLVKEQKAQAEKQQSEQKQWDDWVDKELQSLTELGETFDRNKLMKVAVDMQPTDANGNISFSKALEILKLQEAQAKPTNTVNKEVAAKTASTNQGDNRVQKAQSTNTLRMKSMQSLAQEE